MSLFVLVKPPTDEDAAVTRAVIDAYDFPWEWTIRRNVRETGEAFLPIGYDDRQGSLGYYTPWLNGINVDPIAAQGGVTRFGQTLAHELGHLIDDTCLTGDTRIAIHRLMHDGSPVTYDECVAASNDGRRREIPEAALWRFGDRHSDKPSEAFANLVPHIWCPLHAKPIGNYGPHYFGRADDIKELVMADAEDNPPFDDIAGHTFEQDILWLARNGIAFGRDGKFYPNETMTRGQMAAFLRRALSE